MAHLARTACRRCREQKLRCSREVPNCERCLRLDSVCEFPAPPDRKVLATFRAQAKKRKAEHRQSIPESPADSCLTSSSLRSSFQASNHDIPVDEGTRAYSDLKLSVPVQTFLQDVYFACMFNSTLVFHRPAFSTAFQEGRLPRHVLLAVYASATIFLPPTAILTRQNINLLQPLGGDLKALGRQWAVRAGKEVLQDIDQPLFESVQTCEMLALYWFSSGDSQRNTMFSGIAYKAACTLGLDLKVPNSPPCEISSTSEANTKWLQVETARRCFWAVWFTQCINSDHRLVGTSQDDQIMNLPLPVGEISFNENVQQPPVTLSTALKQPSDPSVINSASPSIMAELMILILNWAKIHDLIRSTNRVPVRDFLADLFGLEGELSVWLARLPEPFVYSKRNLYQQLVVKQQPVYIFVHALYHQCRLVLHSSLVPQFSGLHLQDKLPLEAIILSARIAFKSAQGISELGADILALDWDPGQIAPFVGYCMYVSASIHITHLFSRDASLAALARANLISNLKLLWSMKLYWTNLQRLWARINVLYAAQSSHRPSASEGIAGTTDFQTHLSDLDQLASETRDTGQLLEPLADSVLDYTLRRLKPGAYADSRAAQDLEKMPCPDDLSQLMDEDSTLLRQNLSAPVMRMDGQSQAVAVDQGRSGSAWAPYVSGSWDRSGTAPMTFPRSNGYDWWQLNLDSIQQPILPFDEMFGLDFDV